MNTYKLSEVRQVCEAIYGKKIVDRTWRRWKTSLGLDRYVKEISQANMEQLLTLANLKRMTPYDKIKLTEVIESKQTVLEHLKQTRYNYLLFLLPEQCKGSTIPELIKMVTGQKVSFKTLYRWGTKLNQRYSTDRNYTKNELLVYISQAFVKPNEEKAVNMSTTL